MTDRSRGFDSALVAAFPLLLGIGVILIPVVADYGDHEMATRAASATGRWFAGHLIAAVAFGVAVASGSIMSRLVTQAGAAIPARIGLPLLAAGAALHAAGLGADGVGPLAMASAGSPPQAFFDGSSTWVPGIFVGGAVLFGAGQIILVLGLRHVFASRLTKWLVVPAVAFSASEAIPSGWGLYSVAFFGLILYLPISHQIRRPFGVEKTAG